jgi:hypothetical protein
MTTTTKEAPKGIASIIRQFLNHDNDRPVSVKEIKAMRDITSDGEWKRFGKQAAELLADV